MSAAMTTHLALDAIAWGRAPGDRINQPVLCADGFTVSVQASSRHYANDSHPSGEAVYWRGHDAEPVYPFTTFELGYPSEDVVDLEEFDSGGVWAWVPRDVVARLLDAHGGVVGWKGATS